MSHKKTVRRRSPDNFRKFDFRQGAKPGRLLYFMLFEFPDHDYEHGSPVDEFHHNTGKAPCISMDMSAY